MIIYKCILTGAEMFSDSFKITESKNGIFYIVEGKSVTRTEGFDEKLISANASAEEVAEGTDVSCVSGVDIVLNHSLQEVAHTKKSYLAYIKCYVKTIKAKLEETNPDRVEQFMVDVQKEVAEISRNFKNYQFFMGERQASDCNDDNEDVEGAVGLLNFHEDTDAPYMLFFKDGLKVEKY